ncbi:hypothetical protein SDRG_07959 [Saprolegnia diclina VS20]|uniref:Uncharacterized protein n=1 Tax=Saprolegnia diclina (strain VS20) TaxID=1156394 RepID=T0RQ42_SAPDV|nr:hypothetical protein SDRG_07959 [Saprolegnia diclina VS20]EQC34638.1 hypothetical protein SDRG_07959 [Saprolegnia diclina VS20]|eukprot:XP_008612044.1 hypothetical protein SDRG_07959 [Saprolegnia diclina VS20]
MAFENGRIQQFDSTMSAISSSDGAVSGGDSDVDSGYSKSIDFAETGSDTAPSTPKTDDVSEAGTSSDDEPLSVFREGVRKRKTARHGDYRYTEVVESESEGEPARHETLRDYSYEGELEMLHVPRMAYPFPSYLRQIATEITSTPSAASQHPLLSSPSSFIACQNLPLYLHRRLPNTHAPTARKRARSLSYESDIDGLSDASMLSSHSDD